MSDQRLAKALDPADDIKNHPHKKIGNWAPKNGLQPLGLPTDPTTQKPINYIQITSDAGQTIYVKLFAYSANYLTAEGFPSFKPPRIILVGFEISQKPQSDVVVISTKLHASGSKKHPTMYGCRVDVPGSLERFTIITNSQIFKLAQ